MNFQIRTDLALETREIYQKAQNIENEVPGVETKIDDSDNDFLFTEVNILSDEGASLLNKPIGNYITVDIKKLKIADNNEIQQASEVVTKELRSLLDKHIDKKGDILIVGLGNAYVTPDSLRTKSS